jgi:uncharacterized membrane protein
MHSPTVELSIIIEGHSFNELFTPIPIMEEQPAIQSSDNTLTWIIIGLIVLLGMSLFVSPWFVIALAAVCVYFTIKVCSLQLKAPVEEKAPSFVVVDVCYDRSANI